MYSIDLFSGCGGLTEGLKQAGFRVLASIDIDKDAIKAYKLNHPEVKVFEKDIRAIDTKEIKKLLKNEPLHLLAGCPPCQGFSSIRRKNKKASSKDSRNNLIMEYLRFVEDLKPLTIMLENVPGLANYYLFKKFLNRLEELGYHNVYNYKIVNMKDFGVPQRRKRITLIASRLGPIDVIEKTNEHKTVRDAIGQLDSKFLKHDPIHNIKTLHTDRIQELINSLPKDGGSRKDLPRKFNLACHEKENIGFNDIYGRLRWNDYSTTITGGCLNPSKGRFLHPEENRVISPREAAILQSFRHDYKFPSDISKTSLALMIGNALPPKFSYVQSKNIKEHLESHLV